MPQDGVIRVEDLLRSPALQLRLIAGEAGTARRVAWAHVSELEDPTPWLFGSEMIMTTGIAVPRAGERQRAYLERLDDAGVACLALSEGLMVPPLTRAFLAAAGERGFPVVEVPIPVPFMAISQQVAAATAGDMGQRLNAQLQVFGAVQWLAAGNLSAREIFARLERLSGYALYACTMHRGTAAGRGAGPAAGMRAPDPQRAKQPADGARGVRAAGLRAPRHGRVRARAGIAGCRPGGRLGGAAHRDGGRAAAVDAGARAGDAAPRGRGDAGRDAAGGAGPAGGGEAAGREGVRRRRRAATGGAAAAPGNGGRGRGGRRARRRRAAAPDPAAAG